MYFLFSSLDWHRSWGALLITTLFCLFFLQVWPILFLFIAFMELYIFLYAPFFLPLAFYPLPETPCSQFTLELSSLTSSYQKPPLCVPLASFLSLAFVPPARVLPTTNCGISVKGYCVLWLRFGCDEKSYGLTLFSALSSLWCAHEASLVLEECVSAWTGEKEKGTKKKGKEALGALAPGCALWGAE